MLYLQQYPTRTILAAVKLSKFLKIVSFSEKDDPMNLLVTFERNV